MARTFRIFLSSPGDVAEERVQVRDLLLGLDRGPFVRGRLHIDVVSWDDPHSPAPMDARFTPQQAVDRSLPTPGQCDLTIVLLWGRMGTPLTETKGDGTPYLSGTEWEFENALAADRPVLLYRRTEKVPLDSDASDDEITNVLAQKRKVDAFLARFAGEDGTLHHSWTKYASPVELMTRVKQDVEHHLSRVLDATSRNVDFTSGEDGPVLQTQQGRRPAQAVDLSRLPQTSGAFLGRDAELRFLDEAWQDTDRAHVVVLVAAGGVGKTSLVKRWLDALRIDHWRGADRVYAWSFYSQGLREDRQSSDDAFLDAVLRWLRVEHDAMTSPWDKGRLLAAALAHERVLLILDGLEPLQDPPGPMGGRLRAPGVETLLLQLAAAGHPGLCVVSTRERIKDLEAHERSSGHPGGSVLTRDLQNLGVEDGARLLHRLGVRRAGDAAIEAEDGELREASRDVRGHALALTLLGRYLAMAYDGNIRLRDRVRFEEADAESQDVYAFRAMAAYEEWFRTDREKGARALAVLRLLGLFDRPAEPDCLAALIREPAIPDVSEPLVGISEAQWNITISHLQRCGLIWPAPGGGDTDAHPLVRGYFGAQLRTSNPAGWREGHRRLYRYLQESVPPLPQTLQGIAVLLRAITHGCAAGAHEDALERTYRPRVLQGSRYYHTDNLGAYGAGLGALHGFFDRPWDVPAAALAPLQKAVVLHEAGVHLIGVGRLAEALKPFERAYAMYVKQGSAESYGHAAVSARYLTELRLAMGQMEQALHWGREGVRMAALSNEPFEAMAEGCTLGRVLLKRGWVREAEEAFLAAEQIRDEHGRPVQYLYFFWGLDYCALLVAEARYAEAWRRAASALEHLDRTEGSLLATSQIHLAAGLVLLEQATADEAARLEEAAGHIERAVKGLRTAGHQLFLPDGLLVRARLRMKQRAPERAGADLDAAWEIAERGPMRLHQADILLVRARLLQDTRALARARDLIEQCLYDSRRGDVATLEGEAVQWPARAPADDHTSPAG